VHVDVFAGGGGGGGGGFDAEGVGAGDGSDWGGTGSFDDGLPGVAPGLSGALSDVLSALPVPCDLFTFVSGGSAPPEQAALKSPRPRAKKTRMFLLTSQAMCRALVVPFLRDFVHRTCFGQGLARSNADHLEHFSI
jgi:hypothetical protein